MHIPLDMKEDLNEFIFKNEGDRLDSKVDNLKLSFDYIEESDKKYKKVLKK